MKTKRFLTFLLAGLMTLSFSLTLAGCDNYGTNPVPQDDPSTYGPYDDSEDDPFYDDVDLDIPSAGASVDNSDDPYAGLILGWNGSTEGKVWPGGFVDKSEVYLDPYLLAEYYTNSSGMEIVFTEKSEDPCRFYAGDILYTVEYGKVYVFNGRTEGLFTRADGLHIHTGDEQFKPVNLRVFYSSSLDRVIENTSFENTSHSGLNDPLNDPEGYVQRWPGDQESRIWTR
jgi:hypothetical protein